MKVLRLADTALAADVLADLRTTADAVVDAVATVKAHAASAPAAAGGSGGNRAESGALMQQGGDENGATTNGIKRARVTGDGGGEPSKPKRQAKQDEWSKERVILKMIDALFKALDVKKPMQTLTPLPVAFVRKFMAGPEGATNLCPRAPHGLAALREKELIEMSGSERNEVVKLTAKGVNLAVKGTLKDAQDAVAQLYNLPACDLKVYFEHAYSSLRADYGMLVPEPSKVSLE